MVIGKNINKFQKITKLISKKKYLAIIPARRDSLELKNKNILIFNKMPLIEWTIKLALKSKKISKIIVSTNDIRILKLKKKYINRNILFHKRTENLSTKNSKIYDTLNKILPKESNKFDNFILLQPTSPLKKNNSIDNAIHYYEKNKKDICVSVSKSKYNPNNIFKINNKLLKIKYGLHMPKNRQDYKNFYFINGSIYIANIESYLKYKTFITNKTLGYIMPKKESFDIDDDLDFFIVQQIYNQYF